jgi:serine/threonine protein kinase
VVPIARAPLHRIMNRISEVPEPDSHSCDDSSAIHLNAMSADDDAPPADMDPKLTIIVPVHSSSAISNRHYTDDGSDTNTDVGEIDDDDGPDEFDDADANVVLENNNVVRIVHGPLAKPNPPISTHSMFNSQQPAEELSQPQRPASVSFPFLGTNFERTEHGAVTFATTNEMHLFSPIPRGTSGFRTDSDRDSTSFPPDPLGRAILRRSITEPIGRILHGSSNVERGDVTPGVSFSQPNPSDHFATPQNTKSGQDFDAFLRHSQGAHRGVIENLRRIRQNTIDAMERFRESQQNAANVTGNGTAGGHLVGGLPAVSGGLMDSMPSCMPIPLHRSHSMPVFDGDMSSAHDNNNANGGGHSSLFSIANGHHARLSYQGAWRQNQCLGGSEVSILQHANSHSGENFKIRCAVSSPPQLHGGQSNRSSLQTEMRRESSDNSFGFGMYCNAHEGRESLALSMIGTPPHHEADASMVDQGSYHHPASNVQHHSGGFTQQHLLHQQLAVDTPPGQLQPMNLQLDRDSGEYKQRLKKIKTKAKLRRMSCMVKPLISNQLLFDSSDMSLNMSVDEGVLHSGILGADHSSMLSLGSITAHPSSLLQQLQQHQNQKSTQNARRRVSMAFCAPPSLDDSIEHTQHNPIYVPGQPMANILEEHSTIEEEEEDADSFVSGQFSNRKIADGTTVEYLMRRAVVNGGTFRQEWDNSVPVVVAPERNDTRVDDIRLGDGYELSIHVYNPREGSGKWTNLGRDWAWVNCNPIGFLVTKSTRITKSSKPQFYYLPKHPAHWNTFAPMQLDTSDVQDMSDIEGVPGNYFVMDGVEDTLFQATSSPISSHAYSAATAAVSNDFSSGKQSSLSSCLGTMRQIHIEMVFSYLSIQELCQSCLTLNKYWSLLVQLQLVPKMSDMLRRVQVSGWERFRRFVMEYPRGKFLSDGAFKKVYCIQSCSSKRREALSIMDVKDLEEREIENVAKIEMEISMMCSILESMRICPNMIRVHSMFQAEYDVAQWQAWNIDSMSAFDKMPSLNSRNVTKKSFTDNRLGNSSGRFQYCQMEFCTGGDVEEWVRKCKVLGIEDVRSYLFQMLFAIYASRETLSLRHYDIKLLNFFATSLQNAGDASSSASSLLIGFGRHLYRIPCAENHPGIVKLADFGTSVVGSESLGSPITVQQFTTLENTPFEFLLLGDSARQSFASDTFCLGLSFLHLLTGFDPYEVLLKGVRCPALLKDRLNEVWSQSNPSNPYHVIHMTIQSLQPHDLSEDDIDLSMISNDNSIHDILCDTLYRFLVLLGDAPYLEMGFVRNSLYEHNPVWKELVECLGLEEMIMQGRGFHSLPHTQPSSKRGHSNNNSSNNNNARGRQKAQVLLSQCRDTYRSHVQLFSIHGGQDATMQRVRHRLSLLGDGAMELLTKLLHFDPAQRCTMYDALHHPVFESLRIPDPSQHNQQQQQQQQQRYVYYYNRKGYSSVDDGLPLL